MTEADKTAAYASIPDEGSAMDTYRSLTLKINAAIGNWESYRRMAVGKVLK
jgi:hypothetical protein